MKLKKYILLLFIVITLALTGCGKKIVNLYFENGEIPVFVFDEFKFEDYTFKLERKNGDIEDVQLTLEMFSQEEIQMFKTIGTHNISLEYEDLVLNFNITIYNSKSSYKVEYYLENLDGTYKLETTEVFEGDTFENTADITKTFTGFSITKVEPLKIEADNSTCLKVYYTRNSYKFTLLSENNVFVEKDYKFEESITIENNPSKENYHFIGWDNEVPSTMPSEDVTLNAQFEIDSYTVVFKDFDGTVLYQEVLDYGSKVEYKGETISRDGYTFTGWNNEIPDTLPASDLEFIAEYSINSYNIVFKNHDGVVLYNELVEFNSVISYKGNTPQKEGYTFTKWNNEIPATMPANDLEFIAEFEINVYTVQFKNYDGTVLFTDNVEHGSSATYEGDTPTRQATERFTYTFKEWDTDYSNITSDLIVVALYDEIKNYFILTTIVDGVSTEYKVNNGDNITLEDPVKEGHTFIRWTVDFSNLTDDLTTEALFSINSYKLTYKINGETKEEQIVVYNSDIILIEKPVIDGYYFVEWKNVVEKMPANDHVIELIYEEVVKITNVTKSGKTYDGEKVNDPVVTLSKDAYVEIQYFKDKVKLEEAPTNVGQYKVKVIATTLDGIYSTSREFYFDITKADITVNAINKESIYGEELVALEYNIVGKLFNNDNLNIVLTKELGLNAGVYKISVSCSNDNYNITKNDGEYVIHKANYDYSNISLSNKTYIYDGKTHSLKFSGAVADFIKYEYIGNNVSAAGAHTVTVKFSDTTGNYNADYTLTAVIKILCEVSFYDADENLVETVTVLPDEVAQYSGDAPTKPYDQMKYYVFVGWDGPLTNITENVERHPVFEEKDVVYSVQYLSMYNEVIKKIDNLKYDDAVYCDLSPIVPSFDFNVGYEFVGWNYVNYDEAVYEDPAYRTVYVMPIYESKPASACIGSMYFSSINDALLMASSNDVVTVIKNADANYIIENAIINEGVTLYIPYGSGVGLDLANGTIQNGTLSEDNRYMSVTLTGDLDVYGSLVIGGVTGYVSQYYGDTLQGTVCGAYSEILMCDASSIAVGKKDGSKSGKIDCYGFIRDYSTESNPAKIYVYKNSEVNQPFVIHDWIDVDFGYDSYRNDYSVFNRYSMPCIETETSYYYGGNLNGIGKVYEGGFTTILVRIINTNGSGKHGVLNLVSDSNPDDRIVIDYDSISPFSSSDSYFDRTQITVYGDCFDYYIEMKVSVANLRSLKFFFPITYGMDVNFVRGNFDCRFKYKILPGATVTISEGASLTMKKIEGDVPARSAFPHILVYDSFEYPNAKARYPLAEELEAIGRNTYGSLIVNGTLTTNNVKDSRIAGAITGKGTLNIGNLLLYAYKQERFIDVTTNGIVETYDKVKLSFNGNEITSSGKYTG